MRLGVLHCNQVAVDVDEPAQKIGQVAAAVAVGHRLLKQFKGAAEAEPQQLELGKGRFEPGALQLRDAEIRALGREQAGVLAHLAPREQHMGLPEQPVLLGPRAAEGIDADQDAELLDGDGHPVEEVFQAGVRPAQLPLPHNAVHDPGFELLQVQKAQVDICAVDAVGHPGMVDTGRVNRGPQHARLVHIALGAVKAAPVVEHGHHVFQGEVGPQKKALVTLHGIGGRVPLGKGVSCKAGHLVPDLRDQGFGIAFLPAVVHEDGPDALKLVARAELAAHAPAQHVGLTQAEACKIMGHLDHVFLVDHHPVGVGHDVEQHRVGLFDPLRIAVAQNVFAHHPAFGNPRPDDGAGSHQAEVIVYLQLFEQHAHGGRLHVKAPHALGGFDQVVHRRVGLDAAQVVDVYPGKCLRLVAAGDLEGFPDLGQPALAQDVELVQAHVFGNDHVELGGGEALGGQVGG